MTKKDFKEKCSFHQYGRGRNKRNAIYYDWKIDLKNDAVGYKFMVKSTVEDAKLNELFNVLYDWVINEVDVPYWIQYKFADTEQKRFKVSLSG